MLDKKPISGTGLIQRKSAVSSADGETVTITETWTGAYRELQLKQKSVWREADKTDLRPTDAGEGELTITRQSGTDENDDVPDILDLSWVELRLPVENHEAFDDIAADKKVKIRAASEDPDKAPPTNELELKLYELLAGGTTEYAIGVPVVRRTRILRSEPGGGGAWFRDDPPDLAPPGYEWLKTVNDTRKEGAQYTHTEEWTGAKSWDETLYPAT